MSLENKIYNRISEFIKSGKEFAVASIVSSNKSTPRKSGAKMIITPDGNTEFSIGGGQLEQTVIDKSINAIKEGKNINFKIELEPEKNGMVCGGEVEVFVEVFQSEEKVIVFGGGHIGLALSKILDIMSIPYVIVDDRTDYAAEERFPNAMEVRFLKYEEAVKKITVDEKSYCVIVTQGHKGDRQVLKDLLQTSSPYLGMIGSKNKIQAVFDAIEKEGIKIEGERIYSPIGLDIGGDSPEEIAISIAAEIIKVKYNRTGVSLKK